MATNRLFFLPPELLDAICCHVDTDSAGQLRLTCRDLGNFHTLVASVFHTFTISNSTETYDLSLSKLDFLASEDPKVLLIRNLRLHGTMGHLHDSFSSEESNRLVSELREWINDKLAKALRAPKNVEEISWSPSDDDIKYTQMHFLEATKFLPHLRSLVVIVNSEVVLPIRVDGVNGLTSIAIFYDAEHRQGYEFVDRVAELVGESPQLTSLIFNFNARKDWDDPQPGVNHLFRYYPKNVPPLRLCKLTISNCIFEEMTFERDVLPQLLYLEDLELVGTDRNWDRYAVSMMGISKERCVYTEDHIWDTFMKAGVRLKALKNTHVPSSLLNYLSSYEGLQSLILDRPCCCTCRKAIPSSFPGRFFKETLSHLASTLEELKIHSALSQDGWFVTESNIQHILKLSALRVLDFSMDERYFKQHEDMIKSNLAFEGHEADTFHNHVLQQLSNAAKTTMPNLQTYHVWTAEPQPQPEARTYLRLQHRMTVNIGWSCDPNDRNKKHLQSYSYSPESW